MIERLKEAIKVLIRNPSAGPFYCPVCKTERVGMAPMPMFYLTEMQKYQCIHSVFLVETINLEHYSCKVCGASDRDRMYAFYFTEFAKNKKQINLLDIAPAPALSKFFRSFPNVNYRSADLNMEGVMDKVDITNMHIYKENQFDFIVCSHVLEHVADDAMAIKEIYRVLNKGGKAILMVPLNFGVLETLEDPYSTDIAKNWKYFGQDDHVRLYAKSDYIQRLQNGGFDVEQLDINYFGKEFFEKAAIYPTSVLYVGGNDAATNDK